MKTQQKTEDNWLVTVGNALEHLQKDSSYLEREVEKQLRKAEVRSIEDLLSLKKVKIPTDLFEILPLFKIYFSVKDQSFLIFESRKLYPARYLDDLYLFAEINLNRHKKSANIQKFYAVKGKAESEYQNPELYNQYIDLEKSHQQIYSDVCKIFVKEAVIPKLMRTYKMLLVTPYPRTVVSFEGLDSGTYNLQSLNLEQVADLFQSDQYTGFNLGRCFKEKVLNSPHFSRFFCDTKNMELLNQGFNLYKDRLVKDRDFINIISQSQRYHNINKETAELIIDEIFHRSTNLTIDLYRYSLIYTFFDANPEYLLVTPLVRDLVKEQQRTNLLELETIFSERGDNYRLDWLLSLTESANS